MKHYLLPNDKKYYKVNLHCHTNISDGTLTPEEIKKVYKEHGYSAVAFTDHEMIVPHNDLTDDEFIALHGYEIAYNEPGNTTYDDKRVYHINAIYKYPDFKKMYLYNPRFPFADHQNLKDTIEYEKLLEKKEYSVEFTNWYIKEMTEHGYLVDYNHPQWSIQTGEDYLGLKGLYGFEVFNTECGAFSDSFNDYYSMLNHGDVSVVPIAADDNHNKNGIESIDDPLKRNCFGGYNMIAADELSYEGLINGMLNKDVYASTGVTIKSLYIEDNKLHIECSPVSEIIMYRGGRRAWDRVRSMNNDIESAEIGIHPETTFLLVRLLTTDGKMAVTKAYDIKEYLK